MRLLLQRQLDQATAPGGVRVVNTPSTLMLAVTGDDGAEATAAISPVEAIRLAGELMIGAANRLAS
jgi:hypothetical protein